MFDFMDLSRRGLFAGVGQLVAGLVAAVVVTQPRRRARAATASPRIAGRAQILPPGDGASPATFLLPGKTSYGEVGPDLYHRVTIYTAEQWAELAGSARPDADAVAELEDGRRIVQSLAPRWEVPEVLAGPQPGPENLEGLEVFDATHPVTREECWVISRHWKDAAPLRHCRLCPVCTHEGSLQCESFVPLDRLPDDEDEQLAIAPMWSHETGGPIVPAVGRLELRALPGGGEGLMFTCDQPARA